MLSADDPAGDALAALAADIVAEISEAKALELTGQILAVQEPAPDRLRDPYGQWQPPPPGPQAGWHHTLRHPANRTHLLGADPFAAALYGRDHGPGRHAAVDAHGPSAGSWGGEDAGGSEIPPEGLPEGVAEAIHGGKGTDVPMQPPQLPEASPQRPRRRRRLRYGGR